MNDQTLLLRQVNPKFFENGQVSSQAFFPFPKDDGKLSVYDSDQISVEDAYHHYTVDQQLASVGVWAVNGAEVTAEGLTYLPDPVVGNAAHAVIDFDVRSEKECRKLAKKLRSLAVARGSLYQAA